MKEISAEILEEALFDIRKVCAPKNGEKLVAWTRNGSVVISTATMKKTLSSKPLV